MASTIYEKQEWHDLPETDTPITAGKLDHIEDGIYQNSETLFTNGIGKNYAPNHIVVDNNPQSEDGGEFTIVVGMDNETPGFGSQAFGTKHNVQGQYCGAFGYGNTVEGSQSNECFVEGAGNIAKGMYQHVQGKYNVKDPVGSKYAHIVGGGTSDSQRKNIHTLTWNGVAYYSGEVQTPTHSMSGAKNIIDLCTITQNDHEVTVKIPLNRMICPKENSLIDEYGDQYDDDSEKYNGSMTNFGFGYYSGYLDAGNNTVDQKLIFHAVLSAHEAEGFFSSYGFGQKIEGEAWMQFLGFVEEPKTTEPIKGTLSMSVETDSANTSFKIIYALITFIIPPEFTTVTINTENTDNKNAVYNLYGGQFTDCLMLERIAALEEKVNQLLPSE